MASQKSKDFDRERKLSLESMLPMEASITRAIDLNILVYDSQAKPGEFTERLIPMMVSVMSHSVGVIPDVFYTTKPEDGCVVSEELASAIQKLDVSYAIQPKDMFQVLAVDTESGLAMLGSY